MKRTGEDITAGLDLKERTALVTGASSGLGRECARVLALRGARVLLACRNAAKADAVVREFGDAIGREAAARCEVRACDTASMASVRALAGKILAERRPVDWVFLNAGVFGLPYQLTAEGFEYTCAANYVGHFLLVHTLASGGGLTPRGRLVATISDGAYRNPFSKVDLEMLAHARDNASRFSGSMASPNSKVLLMLMLSEFARRTRDTALAAVTFNGVDPGTTKTDNVNQIGAVLRSAAKLFGGLVFKPVAEGVAPLLWAAISPQLAGQSGHLYSHAFEEVAKLPVKCRDPDLAAQAWRATEEALGLTPFAPRLA